MPRAVEICVEGIESALAAGEGGADRVELCADLAVGGVTPGAGTIAVACRRLAIPVHVLIRPRGGDFAYSEAELEVMAEDIATARSLGAAGVVLGVLDERGGIDRGRVGRLRERAGSLSVTFHKAFDAVADPFGALETLIELGVERVLTSGQAPTAGEGAGRLAELARSGDGRIAVMAGGSITEAVIPMLLEARVEEVHVGSAAQAGGKTDAGRVRAIARLVHPSRF